MAQKWETVAGLEWTRECTGTDNSDRPMYDYKAKYKKVSFSIVKSTDAGFGISVYDHHARAYLTNRQIEWRRSLKNCHARAEQIANEIRRAEKAR